MKKLTALALALMLCLTAFTALAESATPFAEGEVIIVDGVVEFVAPTGWVELPISPETEEIGVSFIMQDPTAQADGTFNSFVLQWSALTEPITLEELQESLKTTYTDVAIMKLTNASVVTYTDAAQKASGMCYLEGTDGMYTFNFAPNDNDAINAVVQAMLPTIKFNATPAE